MRLSALTSVLKDVKILNNGKEEKNIEIAALTTDSRVHNENALFFCLVGDTFDGHDCARDAIKKGAVAVVTQKELPLKDSAVQVLVEDTRLALGRISAEFYQNPSLAMKVIGITGTNGKTTTSYMLASILEKAGKSVGVIGTLGIRFGRRFYPSELTTPDPVFLQKTLSEMRMCGVEYVVMEVSAHALYYKKTAGIRFTACIFTNFTQDHLDFFKTMRSYKQAKGRLFALDVCPLAVLNGDEETGREFGRGRERSLLFDGDEERGRKTLYYGLNTPADAFAVITDERLHGTECMLNINDKLCRVTLSMTGRHNVYNALAAATCAVELGVSLDAVADGLNSLKKVTGRLEYAGNKNGADIYVDFAHTPDGLAKSLDALRNYCKGRLICLFGCGGNRDKTKRPVMGETVAKKADFAILTSDNPRYEDPLDIISDIEKGYRRFSVKYVVVPDRKKAIGYAIDFLSKGDILLVAGKGGEDYQEVMGIKYEFNDQDIIKKTLEKKGKTFGV